MDFTNIKKYNLVMDELKYSSYIETIGEYKAVFVFNTYKGKPYYLQYEYEILAYFEGDLNPNNQWTISDCIHNDRQNKVNNEYAKPGDYNYREEIDQSQVHRYFEKQITLGGFPRDADLISSVIITGELMPPLLTRQVTRY